MELPLQLRLQLEELHPVLHHHVVRLHHLRFLNNETVVPHVLFHAHLHQNDREWLLFQGGGIHTRGPSLGARGGWLGQGRLIS